MAKDERLSEAGLRECDCGRLYRVFADGVEIFKDKCPHCRIAAPDDWLDDGPEAPSERAEAIP